MNFQNPRPATQLSMRISREVVIQLPDIKLPASYELREYRHGDEQGWIDLLQFGSFLEWTVERFLSFIANPEREEGSRLIVNEDRILAATFASREDIPGTIGALDFVVNHPEYRGIGLGRAVCTAVMKHLAKQSYESIVLYTDDWRLPAIGLYLSLGFVPQMTREDMPSRWEAVTMQLKNRDK